MARSEKLTDERLAQELEQLEREYRMSSADFFERYQAGVMGDSKPILRWAWLYSVALRKKSGASVLGV